MVLGLYISILYDRMLFNGIVLMYACYLLLFTVIFILLWSLWISFVTVFFISLWYCDHSDLPPPTDITDIDVSNLFK